MKINNHCQLKYKPDHVYVTQRIFGKVPEKYLVGLSEINFYDDEKDPIIRYVKGKPFSKPSRIDVYMGGFASNQKYSLMHFNFVINPTIVDHIVQYLQPKSNDADIKSFKSGRYNPAWIYMGILSPLLIPMNLFSFLYRKISIIQSFLDSKIKQVLDKNA